MRVSYRSEEDIERSAETLLAEFASKRGLVIQPPVPIEDIVEKHLSLSLGFDELHAVLSIPQTGSQPDIFGALWVDRGEVLIDQSLDPDERPSMEGRYRFTLGHEAGHWQLHRDLLQVGRGQGFLFGETPGPAVICRTSQAKQPIELQADRFSAAVLMPRALVYGVWFEVFGDTRSRILKRTDRLSAESHPDPDFRAVLAANEQKHDDAELERLVRPIARRFRVSPIAMRVRVESLGLLKREVPRQHELAALI